MSRSFVLLASALLIPACSSGRDDPPGGGVDAGPRADATAFDASRIDAGPGGDDGGGLDVVVPPDVTVLDGGMVTCVEAMGPTVCEGTAVCGNGVVDSCEVCFPCGRGGGPPPPPEECCETISEECEPGMIDGRTCESLGYAAGLLRCGEWCGLDTKDCDGCASDPHIVECLRAPIDSTVPHAMDMAATDAAIGLAWITSSSLSGGETRAHFARFDTDLTLVEESGCYDVPAPSGIAIAPSPSGWILAIGTLGAVHVLPITLDGGLRGPVRVIGGAGTPSFGERPGGSPLLIYSVGGVIETQLLRDDGTSEWTARPFGGASAIEPHLGDAVYTGDGFLVVQRIAGVTLARVELDGTVGPSFMPGGPSTETPQIGWNGTEGHVSWTDFSGTGTAFIATIDRAGARTSSPFALGMIPAYFNRHPLVGLGQDTAVVHSTYTGGVDLASRLEVSLVDRDGAAVVPRFALTIDPNGARSYRVGQTGPLVVIAWVGGGNGVPGFGPGHLHPGRISLATVDLGGGPD